MKKVDTGLYRNKPLYYCDLKGKFYLTEALVKNTIRILASTPDKENLVFWGGREFEDSVFLTSVIIPTVEASAQSVFVKEGNMGKVSKTSREFGAAVLAQVHSHPGDLSFHSDGDDNLILFPYEGMLSIVIPNYAKGKSSIDDFSIHQYQQGLWKYATQESIDKQLHVLPDLIDARSDTDE